MDRLAELLGWQNFIGSIEAGHLADIVAVEGDPLKDIKAFEKISFAGGAMADEALAHG